MVTLIAIGIEAPNPHAFATVDTSLMNGFGATLNIIISLSGHIAFFGFQSELADPHDFTKSLILLQTTGTLFYLIIAVVIYRYAGADVKSPALLTASSTVSKVAFGLAMGTIIIAGVILGHTGVKYIYVRIFRGTKRMNERSVISYGTWVLIALVLWLLAWIIAEAIPVFNNLLGLLAAVFSCWFSFGLEGLFYFSMNKGKLFSSPLKSFLTILNLFVILFCLVTVCILRGGFSCLDPG